VFTVVRPSTCSLADTPEQRERGGTRERIRTQNEASRPHRFVRIRLVRSLGVVQLAPSLGWLTGLLASRRQNSTSRPTADTTAGRRLTYTTDPPTPPTTPARTGMGCGSSSEGVLGATPLPQALTVAATARQKHHQQQLLTAQQMLLDELTFDNSPSNSGKAGGIDLSICRLPHPPRFHQRSPPHPQQQHHLRDLSRSKKLGATPSQSRQVSLNGWTVQCQAGLSITDAPISSCFSDGGTSSFASSAASTLSHGFIGHSTLTSHASSSSTGSRHGDGPLSPVHLPAIAASSGRRPSFSSASGSTAARRASIERIQVRRPTPLSTNGTQGPSPPKQDRSVTDGSRASRNIIHTAGAYASPPKQERSTPEPLRHTLRTPSADLTRHIGSPHSHTTHRRQMSPLEVNRLLAATMRERSPANQQRRIVVPVATTTQPHQQPILLIEQHHLPPRVTSPFLPRPTGSASPSKSSEEPSLSFHQRIHQTMIGGEQGEYESPMADARLPIAYVHHDAPQLHATAVDLDVDVEPVPVMLASEYDALYPMYHVAQEEYRGYIVRWEGECERLAMEENQRSEDFNRSVYDHAQALLPHPSCDPQTFFHLITSLNAASVALRGNQLLAAPLHHPHNQSAHRRIPSNLDLGELDRTETRSAPPPAAAAAAPMHAASAYVYPSDSFPSSSFPHPAHLHPSVHVFAAPPLRSGVGGPVRMRPQSNAGIDWRTVQERLDRLAADSPEPSTTDADLLLSSLSRAQTNASATSSPGNPGGHSSEQSMSEGYRLDACQYKSPSPCPVQQQQQAGTASTSKLATCTPAAPPAGLGGGQFRPRSSNAARRERMLQAALM
jgi:hypothetical protein